MVCSLILFYSFSVLHFLNFFNFFYLSFLFPSCVLFFFFTSCRDIVVFIVFNSCWINQPHVLVCAVLYVLCKREKIIWIELLCLFTLSICLHKCIQRLYWRMRKMTLLWSFVVFLSVTRRVHFISLLFRYNYVPFTHSLWCCWW